MSWTYRMRWVRIGRWWHIDNCVSDDFVSVCGVEYNILHVKVHSDPEKGICSKCKKLVVPMILRHGPPLFNPDSTFTN